MTATVKTATVKTAVISGDLLYRYQLGRSWGMPNVPFVSWIMLNPSTADALADDRTIRRCIGFSKALGYSSMQVVNLYAWRAAKPSDLPEDIDQAVGQRNDRYIVDVCARSELIIGAWGANPRVGMRAVQVASMLPQIYCLGITGNGQPRHPLYLPATSILSPWDGTPYVR